MSAIRRSIGEDGRLADLVQALQLAAADAEQQAEALPFLRRIAAEIRSGQEVALLDEQLRRENLLPEEVCSRIRKVDELFDAILEQQGETLLTPAALRDSPFWHELRTVARQALELLGVAQRPPGKPG